jgi:protocatechuate 3,4-dioxygenase beta subunit
MTIGRHSLLTAMLVLMPLVAARGQTAAAPRPATIRGRIVSDDGRALRRAQVTLLPTTQGVGELRVSASTNSQGRYELRDVPAGVYRVRASRSGYVAIEYGQRAPNQPGQTIEVPPSQTLDRIDITLPRGAVLAGRIVDEAGEPFPGVRVNAQELRYIRGHRAPFPGPGAVTDDLGEFRLSGLRPGDYYVMASSTEMWVNNDRQTLGFAATYFPGRPPSEAQVIQVRAGQERRDLDFAMAVSRTARISGVVHTALGTAAAGQLVSLAPEYREFGLISTFGARSTHAAPDGSFQFLNVAPGQYLLRSQAQNEVAALHLDVTGEDFDGLALRRQLGSTVSGIVITDNGTPPDFPHDRLRLEPVTTDEARRLPTSRFLPSLVVKADWTFSIPNVAGPYVFRLLGLPADWLLQSIRLGDVDITDVSIDVPVGGKDIPGMEVVLSRRSAAITGTVVDRDGKAVPEASVVVFAAERDKWGPGTRFVKTARPDGEGRFSIAGLPGGSYRIVASTTIVDGQWEDIDFLSRVYDSGSRVDVAEGAAQTVTIRIGQTN